MTEISGKIIQELLRVLKPFMWDKQQRQSYLFIALGTNANVLNRLVWDTPVDVFIPQMVNELVAFGEIAPGKPAICALLEVIRENVGVDKQEEIDKLIQEINANQVETQEAEHISTKVFKTAPLLDDWQQLETELNNWLAQVSHSIKIQTIQAEYHSKGAIVSVNFVAPKTKFNINPTLKARIFHGLSAAVVYEEIYKFSETKIKTWTSNVTSLLMGFGVFAVVIFQPNNQEFSESKNRRESLDNRYSNIKTFSGHLDAVLSVAISPDGKIVASGSRDRTIKLWNLHTGELLTTLTGHSSPVLAIDFSPDGQTLASASNMEFQDGNIKLWDLSTGKVRQTLGSALVSLRTSCVAFSPDGQTLATGHFDAAIRLWHHSSGKQLHTLRGHGWDVNSITFSRDGRFLVSGGIDGAIMIWNWRNGERIRTLNRPDDVLSSMVSWFDRSVGSIRAVAISPDGETIASGGASDGDNGVSNPPIKLWNTNTGRQEHILTSHTDSVNAIAFSPVEKIIASGGEDNTIRIWNYQTAKLIQTLETQSLVHSLAFSPDGNILVSGTDDSKIRLWGVPS